MYLCWCLHATSFLVYILDLHWFQDPVGIPILKLRQTCLGTFVTGSMCKSKKSFRKIVLTFVWVCLGCHNKLSQTRWFKQQKFSPHSSRGYKLKSGCQQSYFFLKAMSGIVPCCLPLLFVHGQLLVCLLTFLPSVYVCFQILPFHRNTNYIGIGPILMTSF